VRWQAQRDTALDPVIRKRQEIQSAAAVGALQKRSLKNERRDLNEENY
jgi:hypothetical protein